MELESIQQKCDAEQVEKVSPLRDEVARLQQENTTLREEVATSLQDNEGQLDEVIRTKGAVAGVRGQGVRLRQAHGASDRAAAVPFRGSHR